MPGFLLNTDSVVLCAHAGQARSPMPVLRVRAMGSPVTVQPVPYTITGCVNPPPSANVGPCVIGNWISAALRVKAMGMPVLLQDSRSICVPTGTPLTVVFTQMRVRGI